MTYKLSENQEKLYTSLSEKYRNRINNYPQDWCFKIAQKIIYDRRLTMHFIHIGEILLRKELEAIIALENKILDTIFPNSYIEKLQNYPQIVKVFNGKLLTHSRDWFLSTKPKDSKYIYSELLAREILNISENK